MKKRIGIILLFILAVFVIKQDTGQSHRVEIINTIKILDADTKAERDAATEQLRTIVTEDDIPFIESLYYDCNLEQRWRIQSVLVDLGWVPLNCRETLERELENLLSPDATTRVVALRALASIPNVHAQIESVFTSYGFGTFEPILDYRERVSHGNRTPASISLELEARTEDDGFWCHNLDREAISSYRYFKSFADSYPLIYNPFLSGFGFGVLNGPVFEEYRHTNIDEFRLYQDGDSIRWSAPNPIPDRPGHWGLQIIIRMGLPMNGITIYNKFYRIYATSFNQTLLAEVVRYPREEGFGLFDIEFKVLPENIILGETHEVHVSIHNNSDTECSLREHPKAWVYIDDGENYAYSRLSQLEDIETYIGAGETISFKGEFKIEDIPTGIYNLTVGFNDFAVRFSDEERDTYSPYERIEVNEK